MVDELPQQFRPVVISLSHTKQHLSWWYRHYIPIESPHNGNYSPNIKHPHSTVWSQYVCQSRACYHVFWWIYVYACRVRSEGRQKACRPTAPKMSPRRSASQRNVSKGAGMPVLFCSKHARLNFRHVYSQRQCTGPWAQTPAPPDIKVDLLTSALCKADTPGKAARLAFVSGNVNSWGAGPCLRAHIHIHHAEATLN